MASGRDDNSSHVSYEASGIAVPASIEMSEGSISFDQEPFNKWAVPKPKWAPKLMRVHGPAMRAILEEKDPNQLKGFLTANIDLIVWALEMRDEMAKVVERHALPETKILPEMDPRLLLKILDDILENYKRKFALFDLSLEGSQLLEGTALKIRIDESMKKVSDLLESYQSRVNDAEANVTYLQEIINENMDQIRRYEQNIIDLHDQIIALQKEKIVGEIPPETNYLEDLKEFLEKELHMNSTFKEELAAEKRTKHSLFQEICRLKEMRIYDEQQHLQEIAEMAKDLELEGGLRKAIVEKIETLAVKPERVQKAVNDWMKEMHSCIGTKEDTIRKLTRDTKEMDDMIARGTLEYKTLTEQFGELQEAMVDLDAEINEKLEIFESKQQQLDNLDQSIQALETRSGSLSPTRYYDARSTIESLSHSPISLTNLNDESSHVSSDISDSRLSMPQSGVFSPELRDISSSFGIRHSTPKSELHSQGLSDTSGSKSVSFDESPEKLRQESPYYGGTNFGDNDQFSLHSTPRSALASYPVTPPSPFQISSPIMQNFGESGAMDGKPGKITMPGSSTKVAPGTITMPGPSSKFAPETLTMPGSSRKFIPGTITMPGPSSKFAPGTITMPGPSSKFAPGTITAPGPSSKFAPGTVTVDPMSQSQVRNRFEIGKSFSMRTVCQTSTPYHQLTRVASSIAEPGYSGEFINSPLSITHSAALTPPDYQTPFISKTRYGYTDPAARAYNLPPSKFFRTPEEEQGVSPDVETYGTPPAVTPTTTRRHGLFTPKGIFRKKHFNIRRIYDPEFYESIDLPWSPQFLPEDSRSPVGSLTSPPIYLDKSVSSDESYGYPYSESFINKSFDAPPITDRTFAVATSNLMDRTFDTSTPEASFKEYETTSPYALSPYMMNKTFDASPAFTTQRETYKSLSSPLSRAFQASQSPSLNRTFDVNRSPVLDRSFDVSHSPVLDRTFDVSHSPLMDRTFDVCKSPIQDKTFERNHSHLSDRSFEKRQSPLQNRTFDINQSPLLDKSFYVSQSPHPDRTFNVSQSPLLDITFDKKQSNLQGTTNDGSQSPLRNRTFDVNHSPLMDRTFDVCQSPIQDRTFERNHSHLSDRSFEKRQSPLQDRTFDISQSPLLDKSFYVNQSPHPDRTFNVSQSPLLDITFDKKQSNLQGTTNDGSQSPLHNRTFDVSQSPIQDRTFEINRAPLLDRTFDISQSPIQNRTF